MARKNKYQEGKKKARQKAIDFQVEFSLMDWSWMDLCEASDYFRKAAKRYGLTREFVENGIL